MTEQTPIALQITVLDVEATDDELDRMTRNLLAELRDSDVESAELSPGGLAPAGTKTGDPVTTGAIALAVMPAVLPKVVEMIQAWVTRGHGRTVKFKGKIGGQDIEFEGAADDLQKLIPLLSAESQKKK